MIEKSENGVSPPQMTYYKDQNRLSGYGYEVYLVFYEFDNTAII